MRLTFLLALTFLMPVTLGAANPSPRVKELSPFLGQWQLTGRVFSTAFSRAGSTRASLSCRWSKNRFFLVCDERRTSGVGPADSLAVYGYDVHNHAFTYYQINVGGGVPYASPLTIVKNRWIYVSEFRVKKGVVQFRTTDTFDSQNRVAYTVEYSTDKGKWVTVGRGTIRRVAKTAR